MISVRTVAVFAGIGAATLLACACGRVTHANETQSPQVVSAAPKAAGTSQPKAAEASPATPPPARIMDLVVLLDISRSMTPADIDTSMTAVFSFLREQFTTKSRFQMYIADRDMVVNSLARLVKVQTNSLRGRTDWREAVDRAEATAIQELRDYLQKYPERQDTCLVKAVADSVDVFWPAAPHIDRTIVMLSDMNEDCSTMAEPRTEEQLREQLTKSMEKFRPEHLDGIELIGVIPRRPPLIRPTSTRRLWKEALKDAKPRDIVIRTQDQFVEPLSSRPLPSGPS